MEDSVSSSSAVLVKQGVVDGRGFYPVLVFSLFSSGKDHFHHKKVLSLLGQSNASFHGAVYFL